MVGIGLALVVFNLSAVAVAQVGVGMPSGLISVEEASPGERVHFEGTEWWEVRMSRGCTREEQIYRARNVQFRLQGPLGEPLPGLGVELEERPSFTVPLARADADEDGRIVFGFEIPDLSPGSYALTRETELGDEVIDLITIRSEG